MSRKCFESLSLGFGTFLIIVLTTFSYADALDDFYYMKACFHWFRPSESKLGPKNCSLGCSLQMTDILKNSSRRRIFSHQELALCLRDSRTGIECESDNDCKRLIEMSYCKKVSCICEDKAADRYSSHEDLAADSEVNFCVTPADIRSIHIPLLPLFPWRTLLIIFGTLVMTGLLLMTLKWISPIISTIREYQGSDVSQQRRLRVEEVHEAIRNGTIHERIHPLPDKPPPYEAAVQLTDSLPTYDEICKSQYSVAGNGEFPPVYLVPVPSSSTSETSLIGNQISNATNDNNEESRGATGVSSDLANTRVKT